MPDKLRWDMFKNVKTGAELDEATTQLHDNINMVMNVVAPWVTIKCNPDSIGKWMTDELRNEIRDRNNERIRLKAKGKKATKMEWKN